MKSDLTWREVVFLRVAVELPRAAGRQAGGLSQHVAGVLSGSRYWSFPRPVPACACATWP